MTSDEKRIEKVESAQLDIKHRLWGMHPTDRAKAFREIETYAGNEAAKQEETNERIGVPG